MQSLHTNVEDYINSLDEIRKPIIKKIDSIITSNLEGEYARNMQYGMISYTIPHSVYPQGYHCKPEDEVPYISLASQKNFVALYHLGIYSNQELKEWFEREFEKAGIKLDMGKSCIRFKKMNSIPYDIIEGLIKKSNSDDYLEEYKSIDPRNKQ